MTPALKDVGNITQYLGTSPLASSSLWNSPVHAIEPIHLLAFVYRCNEQGFRDLAESSINIAQREIAAAVKRNEFGTPAILSYKPSIVAHLTVGELKAGLERLGQPHASAVLFALETSLDALDVARLTHTRMRRMMLSDLAKHCMNVCPRQITLQYVFWITDDIGRTLPLFGLDAAVFDAFGMVWAELEQGYANLIMIDGDADRKSIECYFR